MTLLLALMIWIWGANLGPNLAYAADHTIADDTNFGNKYFFEGITYNGNTGGKSDSEWKWNAGFDFNTSTSVTNGVSITDKTTDFMAGGGWKGWDALSLELNLLTSNTADEGLSSKGGTLKTSYTFHFGEKKPSAKSSKTKKASTSKKGDDESGEEAEDSESEKDFSPSLGIGMDLGRTTYTQKAPPGSRLPGFLRQLSLEANQIQTSFNVFASPWEWFYIKLGTSHYSYDRNVANFVNNLESKAPLAGITNAASGFLSKSFDWALSFYPADAWTIDLSGTDGTSAVDGSSTKDNKLVVGWDCTEDWHLGLGIERFISAGLTQSTLLLNVSYHL